MQIPYYLLASASNIINIMVDSFSNDVEEAVATSARAGLHSSLTKSSRAWDLDGDGQLDEAELALKNMDSKNTGELSKDEMYKLMTENLHKQKELFKMKKVVMGLVGITCVLALANLGSSFAAAILSKDTMTQQGALVDKTTMMAVKTDSYSNIFHDDEEKTAERHRQRRLECTSNADGGVSCVFHDHVISAEHALSMLGLCQAGSDVDVQFAHTETKTVEHFCICPPGTGGEAIYHLGEDGETVIGATISTSGKTFEIGPEGSDYIVTWEDNQ